MAFSYLTEENIYEVYRKARRYTDALTYPFPEFERISRNRPHDSIDKNLPRVTDGTTAAIIRKTPRRVIQQLPSGKVVTDDGGWLGIVADFIFNNKIIPYANEEYALLQKCWSIVERSLTFGGCMTYAPFLNHDGYFCPDLSLPYWGDCVFQPGKKSLYSSKYFFMRSWWQKEDIQALIDSESKLKAQAKKRKDTYESTWDIEGLQSILNAEQTKDEKGKTPIERERQQEPVAGVELITGFQLGVGATFYTFHLNSETIVRRKINKDPRGKYPIDAMYGDIDGSNPWGRGILELVGGLQNLMDSDMQMYQFNRALMLAPPVKKWGNFNKNKIQWLPNKIIDLGTKSNDFEPVTIDTTAIANYPALYGLQKSQLLNLVNSPDTSISAQVGNPSFSKTTAGVNQQQAILSVDDNYVRKMFETWFQNWAETAINLYFGERTGIDELQLDKATAQRLRELPGFDMSLLSDDNKIRIDYDTETPILKFRVDPGTTKLQDQTQQMQDAQVIIDLVMKYPMLNKAWGGAIDVDVLARRMVVNSGIDDPEQVAPPLTEQQIQAKEQAQSEPNGFSPLFDKPKLDIRYPDLPPAAQVQLLKLAGINVSIEDIMQGPVLDPNQKGNQIISPVSDPSLMLPGGSQAGSALPLNAPDLGDIYKGTNDPTVKAQIEAMAGLHPNVQHVANQVETNAAQHIASQAQGLGQAADALMPQQSQSPQDPNEAQENPAEEASETPQQEAQEQPQVQLSAQDQQLIAQLKQLGASDVQIGQAIGMLHHGYSVQQIIQMLMGGTNAGR